MAKKKEKSRDLVLLCFDDGAAADRLMMPWRPICANYALGPVLSPPRRHPSARSCLFFNYSSNHQTARDEKGAEGERGKVETIDDDVKMCWGLLGLEY